MARLSAKSERKSMMVADDIRAIRRRFDHALALGYSKQEAARLAHSDGPITEPTSEASKYTPPPPPSSSTAPTTAPTIVVEQPHPEVRIEGTASTVIKREDIPPNWQDLPWPEMKKLATQLAGRPITSRQNAAEVIEEFLTKPES